MVGVRGVVGWVLVWYVMRLSPGVYVRLGSICVVGGGLGLICIVIGWVSIILLYTGWNGIFGWVRLGFDGV